MKAKKLVTWGMAITLAFGAVAPVAQVQAAECVVEEQQTEEAATEVVTADESKLQDLCELGTVQTVAAKRPLTPSGLTGAMFSTKRGTYVRVNFKDMINGFEYAVYNAKGKKFLTKKVSTKNLKVDSAGKYIFIPLQKSKLKDGSFYKVVVRSFVVEGSKRINSKWSNPTYIAGKPLNIKLSATSNIQKTYISWSAMKGSTNYSVYRSTSTQSMGTKLAVVNGTSYTVPTNSTMYYYTIVANKKVGKKTYKATPDMCYHLKYSR